MEKFNYGIGTDNTVKVYDNQGAYNTLQEMMKRKEQLIVKFYGSKDNTRCAWDRIRSRGRIQIPTEKRILSRLVELLIQR